MKISGIVITKNSEDTIADCLESLQFCDEIIVVDAGSEDRTADIAKKMKAKVISGVSHSFAEQRNIGLKAAKGELVLYIDTDERISEELRKNIMSAVSQEDPSALPQDDIKRFSAFKIQRKNFYYGNHEWPKIEKLERLFKKEKLKEWVGELHESPKIDGAVGLINGYLLHYSHQDLAAMVAKTNKWSETEAELRFRSHHPKMTWWRFPRVIITAFFDSYCSQGGWKAGTAGVVESMYQAFSIFITYAKLWEMQTKGRK